MANTPEGHFSRRTLAKGAAWAVPAVAAAVVAPSVAASTTDTAPTGVTMTNRTCAGFTVSWIPKVEGGTYAIEAYDGTDWSPVVSDFTGTSYYVADEALAITQVRVTHFVSAAAYSEPTNSDSQPVVGPTGFTFSDTKVDTTNYPFTWVTNATLDALGATYVVQARKKNVTDYTIYESTSASPLLTSVKYDGDAKLVTSVCGQKFTTTWPAAPAALGSATSGAREASSTETQPAETKAPAKKSTEPKAAPAAQKSVPTAEPTSSPTPEPTVSVPAPTPVVTPPAVVPAPTASATPSA